jgi:hypothetical protein
MKGVIQSDADHRADAGGDPPKGSSHPAEPVPGSALLSASRCQALHTIFLLDSKILLPKRFDVVAGVNARLAFAFYPCRTWVRTLYLDTHQPVRNPSLPCPIYKNDA